MKNIFQTKFMLTAITAFAFTGLSAQEVAEPCYGFEILDFEQGPQTNGNDVSDDRSNPEVALGVPAGDNSAGSFFSLGVGGFIEIGFDGIVLDGPGNDLQVVETSFSGNDCGLNDDEFADIELSSDGINYVFYGTICRNEEIDIALTGLEFITAIRITNSESNTTTDGYDLDGVVALNGCEDFPVEQPGCFGSNALVYEPGTGNIAAVRTDPTQSLGAPERDNSNGALNFVSLGFGGTLIIGLDESGIALPDVNDLEVVETTWNNKTCQNYEERADVYVSQQVVTDPSEIDDAQFVYVGQSCTNGASFDVYEETGFTYFNLVKIVDASPVVGNRDGYDVDGIVALNGCQPQMSTIPGECYASEIFEYVEGTQLNGNALPADRTNPEKALGEPARAEVNEFVTLGYGGSVTFGFDGIVPNLAGDDIEVVETSFGNPIGCDTYPEYADIYVSMDGVNYLFAKTVCKSDGFVDISDAGPLPFVTHVKIVNNDELSTTGDSYDLDGVVALHNCNEEGTIQEGVIVGTPGNNQGGISLDIYPNPSTGPINVELVTDKEEFLTLEVLDMSGRTVKAMFSQVANAGQVYRLDFNGSNLPNGMYITKLASDSEISIKKVMIAR
ncbi:MAG: T9SS type A sorting domain-containing protein [Flavobacteriales bacterium]|nr:T9SS type A sorting domain-containing protein [Flavobacteriales bacterium]